MLRTLGVGKETVCGTCVFEGIDVVLVQLSIWMVTISTSYGHVAFARTSQMISMPQAGGAFYPLDLDNPASWLQHQAREASMPLIVVRWARLHRCFRVRLTT